jgi:hypothetical protein
MEKDLSPLVLRPQMRLLYRPQLIDEKLLTVTEANFMELSPSWETASYAAIQELPSIL